MKTIISIFLIFTLSFLFSFMGCTCGEVMPSMPQTKDAPPSSESSERCLVKTTNDTSLFDNVKIYSNGNGQLQYAELLSNVTICGITYTPTNVNDNHNYGIYFHENGQVSRGLLLDSQTIQGVSYTNQINFHENGNVYGGILTDYAVIDGISYKSQIQFHENGIVLVGFLNGEHSIQGVTLLDNYAIINNKMGNSVVYGYGLTNNEIINDIEFFGGTGLDIFFYITTGNIAVGRLATNQTINEIEYRSTQVTFYPTGELYSGTLSTNQMINGIEYRSNSQISFYQSSDNKVAQGLLNQTHGDCSSGKYIQLNQDGSIRGCSDENDYQFNQDIDPFSLENL